VEKTAEVDPAVTRKSIAYERGHNGNSIWMRGGGGEEKDDGGGRRERGERRRRYALKLKAHEQDLEVDERRFA